MVMGHLMVGIGQVLLQSQVSGNMLARGQLLGNEREVVLDDLFQLTPFFRNLFCWCDETWPVRLV